MEKYLFPELNEERARWRYEAMARAPHYTPNFWNFKGTFGITYRYDNDGCKFCSFLPVKKLGV